MPVCLRKGTRFLLMKTSSIATSAVAMVHLSVSLRRCTYRKGKMVSASLCAFKTQGKHYVLFVKAEILYDETVCL